MHPAFDGVLFFPVTPFTESGDVDTERLAQHVANGSTRAPAVSSSPAALASFTP